MTRGSAEIIAIDRNLGEDRKRMREGGREVTQHGGGIRGWMVLGQNLKNSISTKQRINEKGISRGAKWCKFQMSAS